METRMLTQKEFFYVLAAALLLGVYIIFLAPPSNFPVDAVVPIEDGASLRKTSLSFKETGVIRSRLIFEALVILQGGEKHIVSGGYIFEKKLPVWSIAHRVFSGRRGQTSLKVTIPEGFNNEQIGSLLDSKMINFEPAEFALLAEGKEGYLFPDTYFFFNTDGEEQIIKIMNDNFETKIEPLLDGISSSGRTTEQIIIMASIIEKEAKGNSDREFISGILWKRLKQGMALQVDAAPVTYEERGLPDAPIANPGLLAIKAALYPKESPYLYYLHAPDGSIHFAKNFEEHKANKVKYLK